MLIRRAHAWTRRQRWLILALAVFAVLLCGALIFCYERYYRGPSESVFYGTWQDTLPAMDTVTYFRFKPDHTAYMIVDGGGGIDVMGKGKWYAGGDKLYFWLHFPYLDEAPKFMIWHIEDIQPNQIIMRSGSDAPMRYVRVTLDVPDASNQTMERTPGSFGSSLSMKFHPQP